MSCRTSMMGSVQMESEERDLDRIMALIWDKWDRSRGVRGINDAEATSRLALRLPGWLPAGRVMARDPCRGW